MPPLRPWMPIAAGVALLLAVAAVFNHQHGALADARRAVEAAQLALKGQIVTAQESAKGLAATVKELTSRNVELAAAVAQAQIASPGSVPVHAAKLSTGAVVVQASPREKDGSPPEAKAEAPAGRVPDVQAAQGRAQQRQAGGEPDQRPPQAAAGGVDASCVLSNGDAASIEVQEVTLRTAGGNFLVVGTAQAYREGPGPRVPLFGGKFQSALSDASTLAPPAPPRWGAGLAGSCGAGGCSIGPALAFPPLRIFGFQLETTAALTLGGPGAALIGAGIVRW